MLMDDVAEAEQMAHQVEVNGSPLVSSSPADVPMRNVEGSAIQVGAEWVQEFVQGEQFGNLFEESLGESYLEDELQSLDGNRLSQMRHAMNARILMYVAEQELIQAVGLVDD